MAKETWTPPPAPYPTRTETVAEETFTASPHYCVKMEVNQQTKERFVLSGQRILVVDDHPEIVDLVKTYLEREGYEVATAYTGTEVLPLVESFSRT